MNVNLLFHATRQLLYRQKSLCKLYFLHHWGHCVVISVNWRHIIQGWFELPRGMKKTKYEKIINESGSSFLNFPHTKTKQNFKSLTDLTLA